MECDKGSICKESTHKVTTIKGALGWWDGVQESDLPITIEQRTSAGGRVAIKIYSGSKLIHQRG
jgi:hypothetical protein